MSKCLLYKKCINFHERKYVIHFLLHYSLKIFRCGMKKSPKTTRDVPIYYYKRTDKIMSEDRIVLDEHSHIDLHAEIIYKNGLPISLSRIEYRIIEKLSVSPGSLISSEELLRYGWRELQPAKKESLYVIINRLRNKLEDDPFKPKYLISVRGAGYILNILENRPKLTN